MSENFNFQIDNRMLFGLGRSLTLGQFIQSNNFGNVLILVDEGVFKHSNYFLEISAAIREIVNLTTEILSGSQEPDYDYLDVVTAKIRDKIRPDLIVGIGGGSAMDIAKAVAVLITNPGKGINYRGFDKVVEPGIPTLLIPTTAGTGSEVTINAVFIDKKEMRKLGINGKFMNATYALLDAKWTASCPREIMLSAGIDALTHSLESFACKQHNSLTRVFSREAFRLIYNNLPCIMEDTVDLEKRQNLLLGAYLAGAALFNSGSGIAGAFSYPLGVHFRIPHGICGGVFLSSVVDYNTKNGYEDYADLYDLIEPGRKIDKASKSLVFAKLLQKFCEDLGVPKLLDDFGVTRKDMPKIIPMLKSLQGAFDQNPVAFSADSDAINLLSLHLG